MTPEQEKQAREIIYAVALDVALYEDEPSHIRCAHCRALGTPWQKLVHQPTCVVLAARKLKDEFEMEEYAKSE